MSLIESQDASIDFSTSLRVFFTPSNSCFISCLKIEISDVRFPKCSCIWLSKRESLSIICLNCSRLRVSDCLLSSITVLLDRIRLVEEGEGKVNAEFKGWVNFCQSREDSSFTSGILKNHLNALVRPFMGYPWLFVHTSILICKLCKCS